MEMIGDELQQASATRAGLQRERTAILDRKRAAIENGDPDAIVRLERRDVQLELETFAATARELKAKIADAERRKVEAEMERGVLEPLHAERQRIYADRIADAESAWVDFQKVGLVLGGLDGKVKTLHEDLNNFRAELARLVQSRINGG
jgi:hypothetical protein